MNRKTIDSKVARFRNKTVKKIQKEQAIYKGDLKYDKREGEGLQIWYDGTLYVGEWKNDAINGQGKFWHPNGDSYEGQFMKSKADGLGKYTSAPDSGDFHKYEGDWKADK